MVTGIVISGDGTEIGYTKFGNGQAIVISHGSYTGQEDWFAFAKKLAVTFTVYVYDRRGRGQSIDTNSPYTFDKELDDLAAMVDHTSATIILGHSFGGAVALAYTMREGFSGKLIMYEPMNSILRQVSEGYLKELKVLVEKGDLDGATLLAQLKIVGIPGASVEMFRNSPFWNTFIKRTPIFVRELEVLDTFNSTAVNPEKIKAKIWLLLGDESWCVLRIAAAGVVSMVKGVTVYPLVGQSHFAYSENPVLLREIVLKCLKEI
ncbi:alpha/beta fold hydrolase [Litoribacter populi]|uniref:alpha/beta fold hydrolase n=1 Tax=Litoribacter populi TaxID=2598460 RepID=UPI0011816BBC|nr:alpha/beta hydrolase [Litoribacter populi]